MDIFLQRTYLVGTGSRVLRQSGNLDTFLVLAQIQVSAAGIQQVSNHLIVDLTATDHSTIRVMTHLELNKAIVDSRLCPPLAVQLPMCTR